MQLVSIGIGNLIYKEDKFIVPLDDADDALVQYVSREKDKIDKIYLTQNELIYWVFKDFNIQFDETRFLERYFPNQTPLYTRYMNGEDISEWYVNWWLVAVTEVKLRDKRVEVGLLKVIKSY